MLRFLAAILVPAAIFLSFQAGAQSERGETRSAPAAPAGEAETAPAMPSTEAGRYEMRDAEGGLLRLDTRTGAVSFCHEVDGGWRCEAVGDEVAACEQRAAAIEARLELAQGQIDELREKLAAAERSGGMSMPDREDFERAMTYLEGVMRRFMDAVRSLSRQEENGERI